MKRTLYYYHYRDSWDRKCEPIPGLPWPQNISYGRSNLSDIGEAVRRLESDKAYRDAFFAEPILVPGARAWVHGWCTKTTTILYNAMMAIPALRDKLPAATAPFAPPA